MGTVMKESPRCRKLHRVIQRVAFLTLESPPYLSFALLANLFIFTATKPPLTSNDKSSEHTLKVLNEILIRFVLRLMLHKPLVAHAATPEPEVPTTSQDAADPRVENPIDFASLRLENPDIYAWIYIPGTDVNYPVVQHPTDDTFYLKHNKDGEWSEEGAIYTQLANRTDFSDPVTVIYGHNLVQGTMFTTLHRFENKDFFDSHEDMYLYTDGHILTYRIIAAYQYDNRHILNSFNFSDPTIVQQYFDSVLSPDSLVENVREGTTLTSSDKIVQLSTCTGDSNHIVRRYLVTGVLVSDQPTY